MLYCSLVLSAEMTCKTVKCPSVNKFKTLRPLGANPNLARLFQQVNSNEYINKE